MQIYSRQQEAGNEVVGQLDTAGYGWVCLEAEYRSDIQTIAIVVTVEVMIVIEMVVTIVDTIVVMI